MITHSAQFKATMSNLDTVETLAFLVPGVYGFNQAANAPSLGQAALWTVAGVGDAATFGVGSKTRLVAAGCKAAVVTGAVARVTNFGITPNFNNGVDAAIGVLEGSFVGFRFVRIQIKVIDGAIKGVINNRSSSAAGKAALANSLGRRIESLAWLELTKEDLAKLGIKPVILANQLRRNLCRMIGEATEELPTILWAGRTEGTTRKVMDLSQDFAKQINGVTLEMNLAKAGILDPNVLARISDDLENGFDKVGWDKLGAALSQITGNVFEMPWTPISRSFARKAKGKVYAVLGDDLRSNATLFKEIRELIANPKVTEMVIVSPKQLASGAWDFSSQTTVFRRCGSTGQVTLDPGAMISQTVEGQAGVLRQRLKDLIEKAYPESCKQIPVNPVTCSAN
jgi:hypothetical protein